MPAMMAPMRAMPEPTAKRPASELTLEDPVEVGCEVDAVSDAPDLEAVELTLDADLVILEPVLAALLDSELEAEVSVLELAAEVLVTVDVMVNYRQHNSTIMPYSWRKVKIIRTMMLMIDDLGHYPGPVILIV